MPGSFTALAFHVVFATKHRSPVLEVEIQPELHAYIANRLRMIGVDIPYVGGIEDHVHVFFVAGSRHCVADIVRDIKVHSTFWLRRQQHQLHRFSWQEGYAAFTVSPSAIAAVIRYIGNQREHHRRVSTDREFKWLEKRTVRFLRSQNRKSPRTDQI